MAVLPVDNLVVGFTYPVSVTPPADVSHLGTVTKATVSYTRRLDNVSETTTVDLETLDSEGNYTGSVELTGDGGILTYVAAVVGDENAKGFVESGKRWLSSSGYDPAESDRALLTLLETVLSDKLANREDILSYSIESRSVTTMSVQELNKEIAIVRNRIATARRRGGIRNHRIW